MKPSSAGALSERLGGALYGDADAPVSRVVTDSRVPLADGDVFVGLPGPRFDGGAFSELALERGASVAVRARSASPAAPEQGAIIEVDDPMAALQALASDARDAFAGHVVAVTGSNGKTTVKDMLVTILAASGRRVAATPMSYNSQVGVALTLLGLRRDADVAVVECGISEVGEMARLAQMVRPDSGVFVNVGDAHLEGLGDRETTAREKAKLFAGVAEGAVLVPEEDGLARRALKHLASAVDARRPQGWTDRSAALTQDARLAAAAARALGASGEAVREGLASWRPAEMRLESSETPRGITLLNDSYNADPVSMEAALVALVAQPSAGRTFAVLGGMAQLGASAEEAHRRMGARAVELGVDAVVGIGSMGRWIAEGARAEGLDAVYALDAIEDAARVLDEEAKPGDRVLLKASRPERLERLAALLFESVSPTRLEVDLEAVVSNFQRVRRWVGEDVAVIPVVKSFGYGVDAVRMARVLEHSGASAFCVAYPDEGVELRLAGISRPIVVQNVLDSEVDKVVRHGLSAELDDVAQIAPLATEAARQQRPVAVHLKVDTGMGRSGVMPDEASGAAARIAGTPGLVLEGVMTHFAAADDPALDTLSQHQMDAFDAVVAALEEEGLRPRYVHACNSAGLARFRRAHHSAVRVGIGLFGYAPALGAERFEPVLRLTTRVISVKTLPAGHAVGYGATWTTGDAPRKVAVVALGYNDGYPRALSNVGWMRVNGARCEVIGRVCMDVTTLDVTGAPDVAPGDEVIVYDDAAGPSVVELAELAQTIPYELLTRLAGRVRRVFHQAHP